jgi:hypothetical protein
MSPYEGLRLWGQNGHEGAETLRRMASRGLRLSRPNGLAEALRLWGCGLETEL